MAKPVTQMTNDEIRKEILETQCTRDRHNMLTAEIDKRIKARNNKPHEPDCGCWDCSYTGETK